MQSNCLFEPFKRRGSGTSAVVCPARPWRATGRKAFRPVAAKERWCYGANRPQESLQRRWENAAGEARWTLRRGDSQLASSYGICPDFENCIFEAHSSYDVLDNWQLQTARDCNQRGKATGQQPLSLVRIPSFPPGARVGGPGIAPRADPSDRLM